MSPQSFYSPRYIQFQPEQYEAIRYRAQWLYVLVPQENCYLSVMSSDLRNNITLCIDLRQMVYQYFQSNKTHLLYYGADKHQNDEEFCRTAPTVWLHIGVAPNLINIPFNKYFCAWLKKFIDTVQFIQYRVWQRTWQFFVIEICEWSSDNELHKIYKIIGIQLFPINWRWCIFPCRLILFTGGDLHDGGDQGLLLLIWLGFNPSIDKSLHPL